MKQTVVVWSCTVAWMACLACTTSGFLRYFAVATLTVLSACALVLALAYEQERRRSR